MMYVFHIDSLEGEVVDWAPGCFIVAVWRSTDLWMYEDPDRLIYSALKTLCLKVQL